MKLEWLDETPRKIQNFSGSKRRELMTGDADYLLRVVTSDLAAYEKFLLEHLTRIPGAASIKSSFALKQVAYRTALPIAPEAAE